MPTREFFITFLERRRLPDSDGRRLYEYECETREYVHLRKILRECGDPEHLRMQHDGYGHFAAEIPDWERRDEADAMACFVLYASEWYRRWEHSQRRTWARMLGDVFWPIAGYSELYPALVYGLSRWKRPVIRMPGSVRYLDTIAYESDASITGLEVTEYRLVSRDDRRARYEAYGYPGGLLPEEFEVPRHSDEDAPERMVGLFDTGPR